MPRLGEPVEPSRFEQVEPWWRPLAAEQGRDEEAPPEQAPPLPAEMSFPID